MQRLFRLPVGSDGIALSLPANQQIAGVTIDNPSGSWLSVPNVGTIPPYTMAWAASPSPSALTISVLFVDSPSGSPSTLTGAPVSVTLSDEPVAPSAGTPSGEAVSQVSGTANVQIGFANYTVTEAGIGPVPLIAGIPNGRIVPRKLTASQVDFGNAVWAIRAPITLILVETITTNTIMPNVTLTPEQQSMTVDIPPGRVLDVGDGLSILGNVQQGGGATGVFVFVEYIVYQET